MSNWIFLFRHLEKLESDEEREDEEDGENLRGVVVIPAAAVVEIVGQTKTAIVVLVVSFVSIDSLMFLRLRISGTANPRKHILL